MGRYKSPGLQKRGRIWWIDKKIKGYGRLAESCGTSNLEEAERYMAHRLNEVRQAVVYGVRPTRTFEQAVVKYLNDYQHKKSLERDVYAFMRIMPHIGDLTLDRIHNDTLARMALYKVNTGCREQEVCQLRWNWEVQVPELETSVFVLPSDEMFKTKNRQERIVVLNSIARRAIDERRGKHPELVFTFKGNRLHNMLNSAWRRARERAGLPGFRVHDLRHTFGHRLRAAAVSYEDRQDLLGHKSDRITTHYSAPDIARLIEAAEKVCTRRPNTVLRVSRHTILTQSVTQKDSGRVRPLQAVDV